MPGASIGVRPYSQPRTPYPTTTNQYAAVNSPEPMYVQQPPLNITGTRDPYIDSYMGKFDQQKADYDKFRIDVAEGTDQDAVNAMMRERDMASGLAKEAGQSRALGTGGDTGLAKRAETQVLLAGARNASRTSADMAATGRQAQLAALSGATGAVAGGLGAAQAGNAALVSSQNFALDTWEASRAAAEADQRMIAARREQDWQQLMDLQNQQYTG